MDEQKNTIAVIGGGSWATANIKMLSDNTKPKDIFWWMRCEKTVEHIRKFGHNPNYLSSVDIKLSADHISTDLKTTINQAEFILLNVPAAFLKDALKSITPADLANKKIISAIKGIVPDENQIIGEFLNQHYNISFDNFIVISGPCHAERSGIGKTILSDDSVPRH